MIVQEEYKDLPKEEQEKMALFIAQFLSAHEKNSTVENCEIAELKKKENSKVFDAIKNFSQLRAGKTGETAKATIGYGLLAGFLSGGLVAARYLSPGMRMATGALAGLGFGLSIAEKSISKEQLKKLEAISDLLDEAEKLIEDIEFPNEKIYEFEKNRIIVQARLEEGILDADPAIKNRAENFIFRVNELEFKHNQLFEKLIANLQKNSENILAQKQNDIAILKEKISAQKSKKLIFALGGVALGGALGFVGGEWHDLRINNQLESFGLKEEALSNAKEALKAHTTGELWEKLSTDDLSLLRNLHKSLEGIDKNYHAGIVGGLIKDGKLDANDLNIVTSLKNSLHDFTPEVQRKILSNLAVDGLKQNDIDFINNLKADLIDLKITDSAQQLIIVNKLLEDKRVDPSADNNYAIRCANKHGHTEIVDLLQRHQE